LFFPFLKIKTVSGQVNLFKCPRVSSLSEYCDSFPYDDYKFSTGGFIPNYSRHAIWSYIGKKDSLGRREGYWLTFVNKRLAFISLESESNSNQLMGISYLSRYNTMMIRVKLGSNNDYLFYFLKRKVLILLVYISPSEHVSVIHSYRVSSKRTEKLKLQALISFRSHQPKEAQ